MGRGRTLRWVGAVVAIGMLSACSATGGQAATERPVGPPDRDPAALLPALRQIDPCALLDMGLARAKGNAELSTIARGPHACTLSPTTEEGYGPGTDGVDIQVGVQSDRFSRVEPQPIELAGVRGYLVSERAGSGTRCQVDIPVSHRSAVRMVLDSGPDPCRSLRGYAEFAAKKLQSPDTVPANPQPYGRWDGCFLLATALDADAAGLDFRPDGIYDELAGCTTALREHRPDAPATPGLEVKYDAAPDPSGRPVVQVAGRPAEQNQLGESCSVEWVQGSSGVANQWIDKAVFKLNASDCPAATRLADKVATLAEQAPPPATAAVQRPLVYRPTENDTGALGGCVDFSASNDGGDCTPYEGGIEVPSSPEEIMAASDEDRNVQCAVFQDAVRARFGPQMRAISWGAHCFFVEPSHAVELTVNVMGDRTSNAYGADPDLYADRRQVQIAGKPANTFFDSRHTTYDIYLSPSGDIGGQGSLHIGLQPFLPRGARDSDAKVQPSPQQVAAAKATMEDVVNRYFR